MPFLINQDCINNLPDDMNGLSESPLQEFIFYIEALKLLEVLGDILSAFYNGKDNHLSDACHPHKQTQSRTTVLEAPALVEMTKAGDFQVFFTLDSGLTAWHDNIPPSLRWRAGEDNNVNKEGTGSTLTPGSQILLRQKIVLEARFFNARILLFRPLLLQLFANSRPPVHKTDSSNKFTSILQEALVVQASKMCVSAAQNLAALIAGSMELNLLPEWWYNVLYLYTCATVLLCARLCGPIREHAGPRSLAESWAECLRCLSVYQTRSRSASRCFKVLELIDQRMFSTQSDEPPQPATNVSSSDVREPITSRGADWVDTGMTRNQSAMRMESPNSWLPNLNTELGEGDVPVDWTTYPLDMGWLSALPFDANSRDDFEMDGIVQ